MNVLSAPALFAGGCLYCDALRGIFGSVATFSAVCLDAGDSALWISTEDIGGDVTGLKSVAPGTGTVAVRESRFGAPSTETLTNALPDTVGDGTWTSFTCHFENGTRDVFVLRSTIDKDYLRTFVTNTWPGLRRMCIEGLPSAAADLSDDAMLWMVSQKVNAAILVLTSELRLLKCNEAGRHMLEDGDLVTLSGGALACSQLRETRALRTAVSECLDPGNAKPVEYMLILRGSKKDARVPMSLSVYPDARSGSRLLLAMIPLPPDQKRIEDVAIKLGLTPSEARVAALIREGHSNKSAAKLAGLKPETFNTYAKRVLAKMNVSCRSEMAQMLTWQASVERPL